MTWLFDNRFFNIFCKETFIFEKLSVVLKTKD